MTDGRRYIAYTDRYIEIEERMPPAWRTDFLARAAVLFPRLRGADVADILAILDDADYAVGQRETLMDLYADQFESYDRQDAWIALLVARIAALDARAAVYELARTARSAQPEEGEANP